jgi:GntR family transcriptional regulator, galactonate operon transcriptional repressor
MTSLGKRASPVTKERLHDKITRFIALGILRGDIRDGQAGMSSEIELCRHLKVSRTVLREAIKVLEAKRLVEVRSKTGIKVLPRSQWNLFDPDLLAWQHEAGVDDLFVRNLCEIRLIVETAAAELAAVRATEQDMIDLESCVRQLETLIHDKAASNEVDIKFHSTIFGACHNELLEQMTATISMALRGTQSLTAHLPIDVPRHQAVAKAVVRRDPQGARDAMEELVMDAAATLYRVLHPKDPDKWTELMPMHKGPPVL